MKMKNNPLVSIVITTKNEEKNIENCLKSIKEQLYSNIEIIVIDNGSDDKTCEIAKKYTTKVFTKGPERSAQRNYGMIDKSDGKYVMFVDADMLLSPDLVKCAVEIMQDKKYVALHIKEIVLGNNYFSQVRRFERTFYDGTVIDGARFFDKEKFVQSGGFDISMSGPEDWDIDKKMKKIGKIGLLDTKHTWNTWALEKFIKDRGIDPKKHGATIYHNESEFDLKKYLDKKGYYATSFDTYITKWGKNDPDLKKQLGLGYRYFGVFLENGKWKKVCSHPQYTFGMYYLRFLVGIKYLTRK